MRDDKAVAHGLEKGIVAEGHALDIVLQTRRSCPRSAGQSVSVLTAAFALEGVDQHDEDRHEVERCRSARTARSARFCRCRLLGRCLCHYCCTSFLRVAWSWSKADRRHKDEEYHGLRLTDAAVSCAADRRRYRCSARAFPWSLSTLPSGMLHERARRRSARGSGQRA